MSDTEEHELLRRASAELEAAVAAAVEARDAHRRLEDVLAALLAHIDERVVVIDAAGDVVLCSAAAASDWGAAPGRAAVDLPLPPDARSVAIGGRDGHQGLRLVVSLS